MQPKLEMLVEKPASEKQKKTPLLFVHGMWHGAWCWQENFLPYFTEKGYDSYALSLRGHGNSEGRERLRWASLAQYVDDVASVVEQIGTPPILIGHSMGGMVVQKYLEKHQAPAAVLLASAPPRGLLAATVRVATQQPLTFLKVNLTMSLYPIVGTAERCKAFFFSDDIEDERLMRYYKQLQDEAYRAYIDMIMLNLPRPKKVNTELLVLGAKNDRAISVKEVQATAVAYKTKAEIFPDMAHDMMLDSGWEDVADRISNWLEEKEL